MPKKKSGSASKSQAVRDYLAKHPEATASTIRPALAKRGIDVSVALVGQIKQRMKNAGEPGASSAPPKKKAAKRKNARKKTAANKTVAASRPTSNTLTADDLMEAKKLVDELGGIDQARKALLYLEELG